MKTFSIAIFGSALRANFDKYSDKDLLIVSDSFSTLNKLKKKYEKEGYSVSTYTYKKLKFLSEKGSLFVQHLKIESKILVDHKGFLFKILDSHQEKLPTSDQIKESIQYFDFLKSIPNDKIGYGWFSDCFYVGLRNHLILKSAQNKKYNFSYLNLLNDLLNSKIINSNDFNTLRELRVIKKNYRERIYDELPSKDYINSLILIGQKLNFFNKTNFIEKNTYKTNIIKLIKNRETNHYYKLRLLEIYYIFSGKRLKKLDKIFSTPQFYAFKFKNQEFIDRIITEIENSKTAHNTVYTP